MRKFLDEDFLLYNETAKKLYHEYVKHLPIIDYHCHLSPKEIYENKKFTNMTEVWLGGDHYKWRLMRANGVSEDYVTGDKPALEKFEKWAETVPYAIGNPLFHWTHLELKRFFNIDTVLSKKTAHEIYERCNELLQTDDFTPRRLMERSHVEVVCTTDDPIDRLEYHIKLNEEYDRIKVLPTFRPDKVVNIEKDTFKEYIERLSDVAEVEITDLSTLIEALEKRLDFFEEVGCKLSDHALDLVMYKEASEEEVNVIFVKRLEGEPLTTNEIRAYKGYLMVFFGRQYARRGWVMQLHMAAMRDNNTRMFKKLGPDTGYDAINESVSISELRDLLDTLDQTNELPKTILYSLNVIDNMALVTLMGCFQDGVTPGKIQLGSQWWFGDNIDGMEDQMRQLANNGLFSRFVGMLTDSRSFLSYPRHEYFRRILCNLVGEWIEKGQYVNDLDLAGEIVQNIAYYNAKEYFGF